MRLTLVYSGQVIAKKNNWKPRRNPRTGGLMIVPTPMAKRQENDLVRAFSDGARCQGWDWNKKANFKPTSLSVKITIWNKDQRRHDLDNQTSTILDALVKAEVLPDDNQKIVKKITTTYEGVDTNDPRAIIVIKEE